MTSTPALILLAWLPAAEPSAEQLALLLRFRREFVAISPGKGQYGARFQMGSADGDTQEQPQHTVEFDADFEVARYEVPQNLWESVMGYNPSRWKGPRNSVEMISYGEANDFCARVTKALRAAHLIGDKQVVRPPTEAEWEYFARAGSTTTYSFGDRASELGAYAWYTGNARGNDPPVGAKQPNAWQLYDVHGYLWEWCSDHWHPNYDQAPRDGRSWRQGGDPQRRVVRGGSWKDTADRLTSSARRGVHQDLRDDAIGLRCVLASE